MPILIADTAQRVRYVATSGQTVFTVPFEFHADADLFVYVNGTLITFDATPADETEYSIVGAGVTGGGTITLGPSGATLSDDVLILNDQAVERQANIAVSGVFNIDGLNTELNKLTTLLLQRETEHDLRTLRLSDADWPEVLGALPLKASRVGMLLSFDASGDPEAVTTTALVDAAITAAAEAAVVTLAAGMLYRGDWATSTAYALNDVIYNPTLGSYICILAHTSGDTDDEPGAGATTATYWALLASDGTVAASETVSGTAEIATQVETDAGTDDLRFITPLKMESSTWVTELDAATSKLAGIEAAADVTDATNVAAAGALMDSEVTNLADVKAFAFGSTVQAWDAHLDDLAAIVPVQGDIIYFDGTWKALAPGTAGQVLETNGPAANPAWAAGALRQVGSPFWNAGDVGTFTSVTTIISQSFTCTRADSQILVQGSVQYDHGSGSDKDGFIVFLYDDGVDTTETGPMGWATSGLGSLGFNFLYTPGDTAAHTYTIRCSSTVNASVDIRHCNAVILEVGP